MNESDLIQIQCARLNAAAARAMITAMGMQAQNQFRMHRGEVIAYDEADFEKVINQEGIGHNQAITLTTPYGG